MNPRLFFVVLFAASGCIAATVAEPRQACRPVAFFAFFVYSVFSLAVFLPNCRAGRAAV